MVLLLCIFFQVQAQAVPRTWTRPGGVGGGYFVANNWTPSGVPQPGDDVKFDIASETEAVITFIQDRSARDLLIDGGNVHFGGANTPIYSVDTTSIDTGADLTIDHVVSDFTMNIANELNVEGDLFVLNGSELTSGNAVVDSISDSLRASLTIAGSGPANQTSVAQLATLDLGFSHKGDLTVEDGGSLTTGLFRFGVGEILINGVGPAGSPSKVFTNGSTTFGVGGVASVRVLSGGQLQTDATTTIGFPGSGATASAEITGKDSVGNPSRWDVGGMLNVGGNITVSNGAKLTSDGTSMNSGSILLTGVDSTWETSGEFFSRDQGLRIEDGASVESEEAHIGSGSAGSVSVTGGATPERTSIWTNSGDVELGFGAGIGTLAITGHARADVGGLIKIWQNGRLRMYSSSELKANRIENIAGGEFDFNAGTLETNQFEGDLLNEGGTLTPGGSEGGFTLILGDYTQQSGSTLALDIGGTNPGGNFDLVSIANDALVDGLLQLTLINGFIPSSSDEFTVLSADSLLGLFNNVTSGQRLETTDGLGSFVVNYGVGSAFDESRIVLNDYMANIALAGDFNNDGIVNGADYSVWLANVGAPAGTLVNDPDGGAIGQAQYDTWKNNFGNVVASSLSKSGQSSIPEPASATLFFIGFIISCVFFIRGKLSCH